MSCRTRRSNICHRDDGVACLSPALRRFLSSTRLSASTRRASKPGGMSASAVTAATSDACAAASPEASFDASLARGTVESRVTSGNMCSAPRATFSEGGRNGVELLAKLRIAREVIVTLEHEAWYFHTAACFPHELEDLRWCAMGMRVVVQSVTLLSTGDVHVRDAIERKIRQRFPGARRMVARVRMDIREIEQQMRTRLLEDLSEKRCFVHLRARPLDERRDVLDGEWHREQSLGRANVAYECTQLLTRARDRKQVPRLHTTRATVTSPAEIRAR